MKRKTTYILIVIIFTILCVIFYFYKSPTVKQANVYKCPEDYTENDIGTTEYRNALIDWTAEFFTTNPKATISDWTQAKSKVWMDNKCYIAIQRSKMSGNVADLKPWEKVDYEVQNTLDKTTNNN
jgi:uncharacterized protein YxeA